MADNSPGQPGNQSVGRVVVGVIDCGMEFCPRWGSGQAGEQLQDFRLIARPGRGDPALFLHPSWWCQIDWRVFGKMVDGLPFCAATAAEDRARGPDLNGADSC